METTTIDRQQEELKNQINEFFSRHNIHNLYEQLSVKELIELKKIFSCINNIITIRATIAFVNKLFKDGFISQAVYDNILNDINEQHANANGFDVKYEGEQGKKIIAEIKCNIPVSESSFGDNQRKKIIEDIGHLQGGKSTAHLKDDISEYYKFMVILDCDENVKECMRKIIDKQNMVKELVKEYTTPNDLDKEHVFVMYVTI